MRLVRRLSRRDPKSFDARRPHPFIDESEVGTAGIAASTFGGRGATGVTSLAATGHVMRTSGCAVPGCGKAPADEIHAPAEP